ncbi:hypothetical protein M9458_021934, partial [Cirrhinus mrigala]
SPGAGCHGTDVAKASSVCLSPIALAPGRGPSSLSSPVLSGQSMVLGRDFPSRRLSMGDSRGGHYPPPSPGVVEVVGVAPEGAHLIASDHALIESTLYEETVHPEVETLHFMVWTPPAGPSYPPGWYSAGVSAGSVLRRVNPFHPEGLRGGYFGLPRPSGWLLSG